MSEPTQESEPKSESSFIALLNAARAGCSAAFGTLIERSRPYFRGTARNVSQRYPNAGEPSDIFHDAIKIATPKIQNFEATQESKFRAWMTRIMTLVALGNSRNKHVGHEPVPDSQEPVAPGPSPSSDFADRESRERLERALDQLEDGERRLLRMRYDEGLSYARMAQRLGLGEDTVRRRCDRTELRLKRLIGDLDSTGGPW